ncbi:hypothetical protein RJ641_011985 [Dillenia turbinata]|uniref:Digalactosyldiacylglycerol synthase n=1 Tax=Dillenia turbinata TaxID=194707 RepID=A0AAN8V4U6_9MAGN
MEKQQHIVIFTTASLPWMTGTAVNPLFRAAYLAKDGDRKVTLAIPWLSLKDQALVYPDKITFSSPSEQESYVRQWLEERTGFVSSFDIRFYPGKVDCTYVVTPVLELKDLFLGVENRAKYCQRAVVDEAQYQSSVEDLDTMCCVQLHNGAAKLHETNCLHRQSQIIDGTLLPPTYFVTVNRAIGSSLFYIPFAANDTGCNGSRNQVPGTIEQEVWRDSGGCSGRYAIWTAKTMLLVELRYAKGNQDSLKGILAPIRNAFGNYEQVYSFGNVLWFSNLTCCLINACAEIIHKHQNLLMVIVSSIHNSGQQGNMDHTDLNFEINPHASKSSLGHCHVTMFATDKRSILPVGDITEVIPDDEADIAVLEEPEHLTWFHHGKRWKIKFHLVVGVVHTNYLEYVKREKNGQVKAFALKFMNSWVVSIYCHKVFF